MPDTVPKSAASDPRTSLILPSNPAHNVLEHIERAKNSLAKLATVYLVTEAAGHSQATLDAKRRDLQRFLSFYQDLYKHFGITSEAIAAAARRLVTGKA